MVIIAAVLTVLLFALYVGDIYTTKRAVLDNPTKFRELNTLWKGIINKHGVMGMFLVKTIMGVPLAIAIWYFRTWSVFGPAIGAILLLGFVVWRNRRIYHKVVG